MTFKLAPSFLARYEGKEPEWGFNGLGRVVYARTYARPKFDLDGSIIGRETWPETLARVVEGAQAIGAGLTDVEAERLFDYMFHLKGIVGGRMLWQLGTENNIRLGGDSLVNCWYTALSSPEDFRFLFNQLMLGGGVGFNVTEEGVGQLPTVKGGYGAVQLCDGFDVDFVVPDNREGWGELLERTLRAHFENEPFTYSTDAVRPEGAPILTFGGKASGPGILNKGIDQIQTIMGGAVGRKLTTVEVLDIANIIGSVVVSGNVRRSAQIALGDATDEGYLSAKRWDLGDVPAFRAMSNNTVYVEDIEDLGEDFWQSYSGAGEPYGLFNLANARRFGRMGEEDWDGTIEGVNPCGEIPLAQRESCNLAEIFLPRVESYEEMADLAILLYKVQKAVAALPYLDARSDAITNANLRLGLGVTGVAQATGWQIGWLDPTYRALRKFDKVWSLQRGLATSVRLTTVKPSGTLSLLGGVTPGVHPGYSRFHIRRVRMAANDPVAMACQIAGYPWEYARGFDGVEDSRTLVIEFPAEFPEGTILADEVSAVDQLLIAARLQKDWADNAVSVTVTYRPEELPAIRAYLANHWDEMKSVSFLPYSDHGFEQAPLEPISEAEYRERVEAVEAMASEFGAGISELLDDECATGACPTR